MLSLIVAEEGSRFEVFRGNKAPTMYGRTWAHMGTYGHMLEANSGQQGDDAAQPGRGTRKQKQKAKSGWFDGMDSDSSRLELQMAAVQGLPSQAYIVQLGT